MVGEYFPQTAVEQNIVDPAALLVERLGVDLATAQGFTRILIKCPMPGVESEILTLGDFITSPHAEGNSDSLINMAKFRLAKGDSPEDAMQNALGIAAVTDPETMELVRAPAVEDPKKN